MSETEFTYLQHPFRQSSLLCEILQVLGIRIVIYRKVRFHRSQLVMLEGGAHPFRPRRATHSVSSAAIAQVQIFRA